MTFLHIFPSHHWVHSPETDKRIKMWSSMAEVSALVFVTRQQFLHCWNTHGENNSLKSRCTTYTVSCVNLASSRFGLLIVKSYFMHLLLVPECVSIIQVLLNWNYPSFVVVKTLMYCGKQRYDREEDGRPEGGEDEERFHGSTAFTDQWIYPDTFFQLSAAITGQLLFTFLCLWT